MIVLNVTYKLKPGMRSAYLEALKEGNVEERVHAEEGNLVYTFYVPMDEEDKDTVFLLEKYVDQAAFDVHKQQPHFLELQDIKAKYVDNTDIQIFEV